MRLTRLAPAPVQRLVLGVATAGALAQLAVGAWVGGRGAVTRLPVSDGWTGGPVLLVLLLVGTVAADLVAVRVRHGDQVEELTLYGSAVVVAALVLPAVEALVLPVVASAVCSLLRRRGALKTVFNAGNLAAATAGLVACLQATSSAGAGLTLRTVVGLALGSAAFAALNLLGLSAVLAVVAGVDAGQVLREGARLSALEAAGTVALGGVVVSTAATAPALLPFAFAPAAALTFAYRAAAQEAEERRRSERLLALSELLAARRPAEELLAEFLELARQAFGADAALVLVDAGELQDETATSRAVDADGRLRQPGAAELEVLRAGGPGAVLAAGHDLPAGWHRAVRAPLVADGRRTGAVVLVAQDRRRQQNPLGARELALLSSLAGALAAALRAAVHLRRLAAETSKLQAVVDSSSDGILVLDGAGTVLLWSPALAAVTGTPGSAATGRPVADLVRALDAAGADVAFDAPRLSPAAPTATVELVVLRPDGEQRIVRAAHAGVFDAAGDLQRDVVIVHDVTRERQVDRLKADFIATVSHELRTPVTPIKGYADLLLRHGDRLAPEQREEYLEVISDRASHQARLVEDLLLASTLSVSSAGPTDARPRLELATADVGALARRACQDFGDDGQRVRVDVPPAPVPVLCDRVRVVQVLTNLVGNALKYSAPGTPVAVRVAVEGGRAVVEVTDSGRGIPADQLERVFEKFHRVEDPMRMTTGGTGLGLYIARELAVAMHGELTCSSLLGTGSTFRLALSLQDAQVADGAATVPPQGVPGLPGLPGSRGLPGLRQGSPRRAGLPGAVPLHGTTRTLG